MRPFLIDFFIGQYHIRLPSYGIMLALAFSFGYFQCLYWANRTKEKVAHVENLFLLVIFGSVVGARLFHVMFEDFGYYLDHPWKIFAVWEGGYTFYGALLVAILFIYVYSRRHKLNYLVYGDFAAPALMSGLFFGRIGCFLAGCCWGRPCQLPWAVTFTHAESFSTMKGAALHPSQLYEAFGCLLLWFYVTWLFPRRKYTGQLFFHGLIGYAILRFVVEFFRGDDIRGYVFNGLLSYSQLISLFVLPFAFVGMHKLSKRAEA